MSEDDLVIVNPKNSYDIQGKNPLDLDEKDLLGGGHEPQPIMKVIRKKCLDCCGYQPSEVRRCHITDCSLWPYRMGKNPYRSIKAKKSGKQFIVGKQ